METDNLVDVHGSFIFLSTLFGSTDFPTASIDLTDSSIWHFETAFDGSQVLTVSIHFTASNTRHFETASKSSSDSTFVSGGFSIGAIVGVVVGILFLCVTFFVVLFLFRNRRRKEILNFESDEIPRDLEFSDSTLHETLVTYSDTVTVEGMIPNMISSFPFDHPNIHSGM
jgi:hypothetical protein